MKVSAQPPKMCHFLFISTAKLSPLNKTFIKDDEVSYTKKIKEK